MTIDRMRRAQLRRRPEGRRIVLPEGAMAGLERDLRASAAPDLVRVVDDALSLFDQVMLDRQAPPLAALRCARSWVELVFSDRAPSAEHADVRPMARCVPPFATSGDGSVWRITSEDLLRWRVPDSPTNSRRPRPLVTLGEDEDGLVLLDLSAMESVSVSGPRSRAVVESMLLEMATLPWARGVDLVVVGDDAGLASVPRLRTVESCAEGVSADVLTEAVLRVVIVDAARQSREEVAGLLASAAQGVARQPHCTVLVLGDADTRWKALVSAETVALRPNGDGRYPATAALGSEVSDVRVQHVPPRLLPDVSSLLESARSLAFADAPGGSEQADGGAGRAPGTASPSDGEVKISILGPVEIVGQERPFARAWALELVVYLSLRSKRAATTEAWSTALFPDRLPAAASLHSTVSAARRSLGMSKDGIDHLPRGHGRLALGPGVRTDWDEFQELAASSAPSDWRAALALVRGRPLLGLRDPDWAVIEGTMATMEALIVDVASRYANVALARRDPSSAEWAARQALRASPYDERLFRILLKAADASGNAAGVETTMRELLKVVADDVAPFDAVHPETLALYRSLSRRRREGA